MKQMNKLVVLVLFIFLVFVDSKSPKGKFVNAFLTSKQLFVSLTVPNKFHKAYSFGLPNPRISNCETNYDCFAIGLNFSKIFFNFFWSSEALVVDNKRDKVYFILDNLSNNQQDGKQIHLYSGSIKHQSNEIQIDFQKIILKEFASNVSWKIEI